MCKSRNSKRDTQHRIRAYAKNNRKNNLQAQKASFHKVLV